MVTERAAPRELTSHQRLGVARWGNRPSVAVKDFGGGLHPPGDPLLSDGAREGTDARGRVAGPLSCVCGSAPPGTVQRDEKPIFQIQFRQRRAG